MRVRLFMNFFKAHPGFSGIGLIVFMSLLGSCTPNRTEPLTIAAAANLQHAIVPLMEAFTEETGIPCQRVVSSSGKLTAQIRAGAPFDVLVSANLHYPETLFEEGLTLSAPRIYAHGKLVIWTTREGIRPHFDQLPAAGIQHIALANPDFAPYGKAAEETLRYHKLLPLVEKKLVYGESIAQTHQFISSQSAEVGFTALSLVLSSDSNERGHWTEVPSSTYSPITQGVVVLKNRESQQENARRFQDFLFSERGKEILSKFGYSVDSL